MIKGECGENISGFARRIIEESIRTGRRVEGKFNELPITANYDDSVSAILWQYEYKCLARRKGECSLYR